MTQQSPMKIPPNQPKNLPQKIKPTHLSTLLHNIQPISPPAPPSDLQNQSFLERTASVLSFTLRSIEYSISPKGYFRHWFKFCFRIALYLAVPTVLFAPILNLIFQQSAIISESFLLISQNLWLSLLVLERSESPFSPHFSFCIC